MMFFSKTALYFFTFLLFIILPGCTSPASIINRPTDTKFISYTQPDLRGLQKHHQYSCVVTSRGGLGSGIIVAKDSMNTYVVTSYHVISSPTMTVLDVFINIPIYDVNQVIDDGKFGFIGQGRVIRADPKNDVAIIRVPMLFGRVARASTTLPKVGDRVYSISNPMNYTAFYGEGYISRVSVHKGIYDIMATLPIYSGASGGGLFMQDSNVLVGITKSRLRFGDSIGHYVPFKYVAKLLDDKGIKWK